MSYVWGPEGPAFEYPTCYRTENRFLTLRAATLLIVASAILWLALTDPAPPAPAAALLRAKVERGSWVPHLLAAMFLLAVGFLDLFIAARQRRVRLAAGQPAPLAGDLSFNVTGGGPGAAWLLQVMTNGRVATTEPAGPYRRALKAVSRQIATAPVALQAHLRLRIANLLFTGGLLLALAVTWALASQRPTWPLVAVFFGVLAVAQVVYSGSIADRAAGPPVVAVGLLMATGCGLLIAWYAGSVPGLEQLQLLTLPVSAALLLLGLLVIDGLALLAASAQVDGPPRADRSAAAAAVVVHAAATRLMQEIDGELMGRWVDGVPNRRYIRYRPLGAKADAAAGPIVALEESQPTLSTQQRERLSPLPWRRRAWLLILATLGLLLTLAGGVLWVHMANALMQDAAAGWASAAPALVLILAGGYAVRAGHLMWSRIEVESTLFLVSIEPAVAQPPKTDRALDEEAFGLQARVVRAVSVFYAAAEHTLGSRRLLRLAADEPAALSFVQQVNSFSRRTLVAPPAEPKARASLADPSVAPTAARGMPRFCPACGTPLLQGARFCQNCGKLLAPM